MKRRGFTLAELVIVIGVSTLLVSTVIALLVSLREYSQFRAADIPVRDEIQSLERRIKDFFASYDSAEYPAPETDAAGSVLRFGSDTERIAAASAPSGATCIITFTSTSGGKITKKTVTALAVTSVLFEKGEGENIVKVIMKYRDNKNEEKSYSFMLVKQSMNKAVVPPEEP